MTTRRDDPFYAGLAAGERFPQRRTAPRYFLVWQIDVFEPVSRTNFTAQTNLVSTKGCFIRATAVLAPGAVVRLQIKWREEAVEVWARVTGAPADSLIGVAFLGTQHQEEFARWIGAEIGTP